MTVISERLEISKAVCKKSKIVFKNFFSAKICTTEDLIHQLKIHEYSFWVIKDNCKKNGHSALLSVGEKDVVIYFVVSIENVIRKTLAIIF